MGMWELMSCTTETVKRYTPGLASIKNASVAIASVIDNAVRVEGLQNLYAYIPDADSRSQIASFAGKFAKNALLYGFQEGYKLIPGGKAVGKIVSMTANDMKSENCKRDSEIKVSLKENRAMISENFQSDIETKMSSKEKSPTGNSVSHRKPEDVLRVFMMKEFIGTHFLDDLIVPGAKKPK